MVARSGGGCDFHPAEPDTRSLGGMFRCRRLHRRRLEAALTAGDSDSDGSRVSTRSVPAARKNTHAWHGGDAHVGIAVLLYEDPQTALWKGVRANILLSL